MGILDLIKGLKKGQSKGLISWKVDEREGIDFIFDRAVLEGPEKYAIEDPHFGFQLTYLKSMHEQSKAAKNANGYTVLSQVAVELDDDFSALFDFPEVYKGKYITRIDGNTSQASFNVSIDLQLPDGGIVSTHSLFGPFLKVSENEIYRLSSVDWQALRSLETHKKLPSSDRGEYENNWLVFQLQVAKRAGMPIHLAHFNNLDVVTPDKVGVSIETRPNGDIELIPAFGSGIKIDDIKSRLGQISNDESRCVLRIRDKFVLLDESKLHATREILTNRTIPKEQVSTFLKSPTAYLDAALIDLDTGFSLRVHGAERFSHRYFGDVEKSGVDWFARGQELLEPLELLSSVVDSLEKLAEVESLIKDAQATGASIIEVEDRIFDISDQEKVDSTISNIRDDVANTEKRTESFEAKDFGEEPAGTIEKAVVAIDSNDDCVEYAGDVRVSGLLLDQIEFSKSNLRRKPFPHQEEGIRWMLSHLDMIRSSRQPSGALLADDMGLGKTFMTLVAIGDWYRRCKDEGASLKPCLVVAPLSLVENWLAEVDATFDRSPFIDIVVLQAGANLSRFRVKGAKSETQQKFLETDRIENKDEIRYSLKIGSIFGSDRLDMPARLVLTTYQTMRDYQFSLSRVDWGMVVFDEAQNLKNPNALATRAAKGLKADFKLLATGTPVENSLKDFWCLLDTAAPGLLGAWQSFRLEYITPILSADANSVRQTKIDVGKKLRSRVGDYMLRRTKAEKLSGLPEKRIFTGDGDAKDGSFLPVLAAVMTGSQLSHYDEVISRVKNCKAEDKRGLILPSLRKLKVASIHHELEDRASIPSAAKELLKQAERSSKIKSVLYLLKEIEKRQEKVLIFAETKVIQAYIAALVTSIFRISVEIINGETKAVADKDDGSTRKSIIDRFQSQKGFGVIVMSPIAAGVGLTVVGANNVIHLERHWNPAKEAQATDRVYRIGQERDVNVYLPMALHPNLRSFDLQLNSLLSNKIDLSDAVVAVQSVEPGDLVDCF